MHCSQIQGINLEYMLKHQYLILKMMLFSVNLIWLGGFFFYLWQFFGDFRFVGTTQTANLDQCWFRFISNPSYAIGYTKPWHWKITRRFFKRMRLQDGNDKEQTSCKQFKCPFLQRLKKCHSTLVYCIDMQKCRIHGSLAHKFYKKFRNSKWAYGSKKITVF